MDELMKALMVKKISDTHSNKQHVIILSGPTEDDCLLLYELFEKHYMPHVMYVKEFEMDEDDPYVLSNKARNKLKELGTNFLYIEANSRIEDYKDTFTNSANIHKTLVLDMDFVATQDYIYERYHKYFNNFIFVVRQSTLNQVVTELLEFRQSKCINPFTDFGLMIQIGLEDNPNEIQLLNTNHILNTHKYANAIKFDFVDCPHCHRYKFTCYHLPNKNKIVKNAFGYILDVNVTCPYCEKDFAILDYEIDKKERKQLEILYNTKVNVN